MKDQRDEQELARQLETATGCLVSAIVLQVLALVLVVAVVAIAVRSR